MSFRIDYKPLWANITDRQITLGNRSVPRSAGLSDIHVSLPLQGKRWRPHVTTVVNGKRTRTDLACVPFDEVVHRFQTFGSKCALVWLSLNRPTSLEQMADEGYFAVRDVGPGLLELARRVFRPRLTANRIQVRQPPNEHQLELCLVEMFELMNRHLVCVSEVQPSDARSGPIPVFGIDELEWGLLSFTSREDVGMKPGWRYMPATAWSVGFAARFWLETFGDDATEIIFRVGECLGLGGCSKEELHHRLTQWTEEHALEEIER